MTDSVEELELACTVFKLTCPCSRSSLPAPQYLFLAVFVGLVYLQ